MTRLHLLAPLMAFLLAGCGRFEGHASGTEGAQRIVCIGQAYNEMIYALGAQGSLAGVDYSSTYPPEIKTLPTVGYHRALSAEGILSLHPTLILDDDNIGPDQVVRQLQALHIPMKTFGAKNDSVAGTEALLREMGAFFHKEKRAEELCAQMERGMADAAAAVKQYRTTPRVAVIHFGRASNVYLLVGSGGGETPAQRAGWSSWREDRWPSSSAACSGWPRRKSSRRAIPRSS